MTELNERAKALYAIRTNLGWTPAKVAAMLDVSPRMVGMWETGTQDMPDGRWRLFMHEVNAELDRGRSIVVVRSDDGLRAIDAVSDANFYDIKVNHSDGTAAISSYGIDRQTQRPCLHTRLFKLKGNEHVLQAALAWEAGLRVGAATGEKEMLAMHRWLTNRILEAEKANPRLRELKNAIAEANDAVDQAPDEETKRKLLKAFDQAVLALIHEVEQSRARS